MAQLSGGAGGGSLQATYVAAGLSLTNNQSVALLLDQVGNLRVNPGALTSASDSVSTVQGAAGLVTTPWFVELSNGTNQVGTNSAPLFVSQNVTSTATVTRPTCNTGSLTILASNANRRGASIFNEGPSTMFIKLGATSSTTSYWTQLSALAYAEVPFGYTGVIDAIISAGTCQPEIVEFTV